MSAEAKAAAAKTDPKRTAMQFIVLMGIVSLFGDITYEGARSITGPYLAVLGASAAMVGLVSGLGEFIGYALRLLTGYFADRTRAYWPLTFIGYALIMAIPLLAFTHHWQSAALLIVLERMGKAIRSPARDAILSHATKQVGRGWGFAVHEALDQIGAFAGPLIFTTVFLLRGTYAEGFRIFWIPVLLMLVFLTINYLRVPKPERLEADPNAPTKKTPVPTALSGVFWLYTLFIVLTVGGYASFQLIAYHLKAQAVVSDAVIPLFYAIAMGVDAVVALIVGRAYDKIGLRLLIVIPVLTAPIPFLAFAHSLWPVVAGVVLWGAVMGVHETIMRAAIADLTPIEKRGFAYGIFNTAYGLSWLISGVVMGNLYEHAMPALLAVAVALQALSLPAFWLLLKSEKRAGLSTGS
jgi:MFS family permease